MNKIKKMVGLLLAIAMVFTLAMPGSIAKAETVGAGTDDSVTITGIDVVVDGFFYEGAEQIEAGYTDEETGEWIQTHLEFPVAWAISEYLITTSDGVTTPYTMDGLLETYGDVPGFSTDQSATNPWKVGMHTAKVSFMGVEKTFEVEVVANPIENIEVVTSGSMYEGTSYERYECDEETESELPWQFYNVNNIIEKFIVTETDGTVKEFESQWQMAEAYDKNWPELTTDQAYGNEWGVGTHTATITMLGKSFDFTVEIVENPIANIEVVMKGAIYDGTQSTDEAWNSEAGEWVEYKYFEVQDRISSYIITETDGTVRTLINEWDVQNVYGQSFSISTDQSYENRWDVGMHEASITLLGKTFEFDVEILANPVSSISVTVNNAFYDGAQTGETYEYDEVNDQYISYPIYDPGCLSLEVTVTTTEGTVETYVDTYDMYKKYGAWPEFETDQAYTNQWGVGTHTATLLFMEKEAEFEVEVVENPIADIEVVTKPIYDGMQSDYNWWDEETDSYIEFAYYDVYDAIDYFNVLYTDGTTKQIYDDWELYESYGVWPEFDTDQTPENVWGIGTHTATMEFMGQEYTFTLTVKENPIKDIQIETVTMYDGAQMEIYDWDEELEEDVLWYKEFDVQGAVSNITVTTKDGTVETYDSRRALYEAYGAWAYVHTDQNDENVWGIGTHTATFEFLGNTYEFDVEVVENPIISINVITEGVFYEGGQTQEVWEYDDITGEEYVDYMQFNVRSLISSYEVTTKDGTTTYDSIRDLSDAYNAEYEFITDQSKENVWMAGTHTATFKFIGNTYEFDVEVVESPIESVTAVFDYAYVGESVYPEDILKSVTITEKDGTSNTFEDIFGVTDAYGTWIEMYFENDVEEMETVGTATVIIQFMGNTSTGEVEIIESPVASIDITMREAYIGDKFIDMDVDGNVYGEILWASDYIDSIDVTYTDGTTETTTVEALQDKFNRWLSWTDDTGEFVKVGTYQVRFNFMGAVDTVDFVITDKVDEVTIVNTAEQQLVLQRQDAAIADAIETGQVDASVMSEETAQKAKAAFEDDMYLYTTLVVNEVNPEDLSTEEVQKLQDAVESKLGTSAEVQYIDVDVVLYADDEELGNIYELDEELSITVGIPESMKKEDATYCVVRIHNGEVTVLPATKNDDGTLTFKTDKFSTYAIAFVEGDVDIENPFTDVDEEDYFYAPVLWAYQQGITAGVEEDIFAPKASCTRAQVVSFLWRAEGYPEPAGSTNPFVDLKAGEYYVNAVQWAYENQIAAGTSDTEFSPKATVTRAQFVSFLWRLAGCPEPAGTENSFTDVKSSKYYAKAVQWAVENGIAYGVSSTEFAPEKECTRAQVVSFLHRYYAE